MNEYMALNLVSLHWLKMLECKYKSEVSLVGF